jgi:hypothetical protein
MGARQPNEEATKQADKNGQGRRLTVLTVPNQQVEYGLRGCTRHGTTMAVPSYSKSRGAHAPGRQPGASCWLAWAGVQLLSCVFWLGRGHGSLISSSFCGRGNSNLAKALLEGQV